MINIIKKYIKDEKVYSKCTEREKAQIEFAINMVETELNELRDKLDFAIEESKELYVDNALLMERIKRLDV